MTKTISICNISDIFGGLIIGEDKAIPNTDKTIKAGWVYDKKTNSYVLHSIKEIKPT